MVKGIIAMKLQSESGPFSLPDERDIGERTVRAAVEAAVFAERARCAKVARNAWMQHAGYPYERIGPVSVCDWIATLIETTT